MQTAFGKLLKTLVYQHFDSARAFVRAVGGFNSESAGVAHVSQVISGKLPPPFKRLDAWAKALRLSEGERERFLDLATIALLPEEARPRFERILARLETIEKRGK